MAREDEQLAPSTNRSGYKGVCWHKVKGKWSANIAKDGRKYHLGYFDDAFVAALVYDAAARELHGEYAHFNFTLDDLLRICCPAVAAVPAVPSRTPSNPASDSLTGQQHGPQNRA